MINQDSIDAVKGAYFQKEFVHPLYESYNFARIPATIQDLFDGKRSESSLPHSTMTHMKNGYDTVILLFIDGFGWRFYEHYLQKYPFLEFFAEKGIASKITSQFPSTTAAHVTCIHTGLDVGTSGVYEWFYYEPKVDRVIAPLLSSYAGDKSVDTLEEEGIDVVSLYPKATIYEAFKKQRIHSYIVQHTNIAHSPYSRSMCKGATYVPYKTIGEGLDSIMKLMQEPLEGEKRYICFYVGDIDSAGHRHGLFSPEYDHAVDQVMTLLNKRLLAPLQSKSSNAAVLVTADHGMTKVDPATTVYLNAQFPEVLPLIKRNKRGEMIAPAGSCRDFFLHIEDAYLDQAASVLSGRLKEMAWVVKTKELIERGFFGLGNPSKDFMSRVGNLVLLPYGHESIWWYEKDRFDQHFFAMHGGLTRAEMETIFLFASLPCP